MLKETSRIHNQVEGNGVAGSLEAQRANILSTLEKYRNNIPRNDWDLSMSRIKDAFDVFSGEKPTGKATSAFLIHTRRDISKDTSGSLLELDDSSRFFPVLKPEYGIPEEEVEEIWNTLPPFKAGEIKGNINGVEMDCALISVPITPKKLENCKGPGDRVRYAQPRIKEAGRLADRMGAKIIGLGETMAALTSHGKKLQEEFPNTTITTGHAFTTYFMNEWTKFCAKENDIDLSKASVAIIGANGSIGSAMTEMLLLEGVGELKLHDRENMINSLNKKKEDIEERFPGLIGKVKVSGGNESLKEACEGSKIVLVAASAPKPFIKAEHLDKGTIVINDSQPPSITREEAQKADSVTVWVVGSLPDEMESTFNSGLRNAEWTCALEVLALEAGGKGSFETVGPVTPERVENAGRLAKKLGITLAQPQSWGTIENINPSTKLQTVANLQ